MQRAWDKLPFDPVTYDAIWDDKMKTGPEQPQLPSKRVVTKRQVNYYDKKMKTGLALVQPLTYYMEGH